MSNREWILVRGPDESRGSLVVAVQRPVSLNEACATAARAAALACAALLITCAMMRSSVAQIVALQQPQFSLMDENGVDLLSENLYLHETDTSIGSQEHPLAHTMYSGPDGAWTLPYPNLTQGQALFGNAYAPMDAFSPGEIQWPNGASPAACPPASSGLPVITVQLGNSSEVFQAGTGCQTFKATEPTGDTLVLNSWPDGTFTYTKRDGTQVIFSGYSTVQFPPDYTVQEIIYPDGRVLTYWYTNDGEPYLKSVTRSDGLQLKYTYGQMSNGEWELTAVTAVNNAYEYCSPTADTCALKMTWPTATYSYSGGTGTGGLVMMVTDAAGWPTTYTMDGYGRTVGISSASENFTYFYCDSGCTQYNVLPALARAQNYVQVVTRGGQNWVYTGNPGSISPGTCTTASYGFTNPAGSGKTVLQQLCETADGTSIDSTWPAGTDPFEQMTDEQGNVDYGNASLIMKELMPEGNAEQYSWYGPDLAGVTRIPKPGSPLTSVTLSANYGWSGCNSLTCNEPNWVNDGNGNETDYTYDPANGEVLTVTRPPDAGGIRPQTNYTYTQQTAWALNAAGQYVASPPIWVRSTESYCLTSKATTDLSTGQVDCASGTGDKVLKTFYYGPNSGPNNLFLRGVQVQASGAIHVTCYGYDPVGHQVSVTTPNAGLSLTSCDQFTQN